MTTKTELDVLEEKLAAIGVSVVDENGTKRLVTAGGRKLKVRWTPVVVRDFQFVYGIDAEKEIAQAILDSVLRELGN